MFLKQFSYLVAQGYPFDYNFYLTWRIHKAMVWFMDEGLNNFAEVRGSCKTIIEKEQALKRLINFYKSNREF